MPLAIPSAPGVLVPQVEDRLLYLRYLLFREVNFYVTFSCHFDKEKEKCWVKLVYGKITKTFSQSSRSGGLNSNLRPDAVLVQSGPEMTPDEARAARPCVCADGGAEQTDGCGEACHRTLQYSWQT
jgi:hypothetical protein